jgi:hypothetical protein
MDPFDKFIHDRLWNGELPYRAIQELQEADDGWANPTDVGQQWILIQYLYQAFTASPH